ncbi:hypothetical protein PPGU16_24810 [Paraburkholderia largidicola]|uniref:Acyltransferase 3 domain-containing protein n=2 Tax=Paraburkholderia largidicola TaxID=3014751 RepID=A0A7I8BL67_9BURK|nr:hypothetical protein PPGU16_24810 [Paraburkholderia sp. PGU16]
MESASARFHAIDGLRGFLALGVVFHHVVINYQFYRTGNWALTPSKMNIFLGRGSVAFFFMITAFLFWSRVINRRGQIDAYAFYVSRLRRMLPMYLVSATLMIVTALAFTHFRLQVPLLDLVKQVLSWLLFTIPGIPSINNFDQTTLINTVYWTLVYEWKFYLILPLAAVFAVGLRRLYLAVFVTVCILLFSTTQFEWFFLGGCVAAVASRVEIVRRLATTRIGSVVALAAIAAAIAWAPLVYEPWGAVLLFLPFMIFASGNTMGGVLTWRSTRTLGLLSYSIYLIHNWVLYLGSRLYKHFSDLGALSVSQYWLFGCAVVLITVALSAATYRFVEYPWLRSSRPVVPRSATREAKFD